MSTNGMPPQLAVLDMVQSRWRSAAIGAIARSGVIPLLVGGPRTVEQLAAEVAYDTDGLYRVMRALARIRVFEELPERRFALTPLSRPLLADHKDSVLNMVLNMTSEREHQVWANLEHTMRTGEPAQLKVFGKNLWAYFDEHVDEAKIFHEGMKDLTRQTAQAIAKGYDFSRFSEVIDVGGGGGELLSAILTAHPSLRGTLYDSTQAVADAPAVFAEAGVDARARVTVGDAFRSIPTGYDAYVMKNVVHGFGDDQVAVLLRNVTKAMKPGAVLLLVEHVVAEAGPYMQFLDLQMLLGTDYGRERTRDEFAALLEGAGLVVNNLLDRAGPLSIMECLPSNVVARRQPPLATLNAS